MRYSLRKYILIPICMLIACFLASCGIISEDSPQTHESESGLSTEYVTDESQDVDGSGDYADGVETEEEEIGGEITPDQDQSTDVEEIPEKDPDESVDTEENTEADFDVEIGEDDKSEETESQPQEDNENNTEKDTEKDTEIETETETNIEEETKKDPEKVPEEDWEEDVGKEPDNGMGYVPLLPNGNG